MRDPEFEKEVREKMDELKFSPSESVWISVQRRIAKDKRRRPLFWIFIMASIILPGGLYFVLKIHNRTTPSEVLSIKAIQTAPVKLSHVAEQQSAAPANKTIVVPRESVSASSHRKSGTVTERGIASISGHQNENAMVKGNSILINDTPAPESLKNVAVNRNTKEHSEILIAVNPQSPADNTVIIDSMKFDNNTVSAAKKSKAVDSPANRKQQKKPSSFSFGFSAKAGMSDIFTANTSTPSANAPNTFYNNYPAINVVPGAVHEPSALQPGFSFSAGITGEQKLWNKISLSFGLNYHYYSGNRQTGIKINPNTTGSAQANGYYAWGTVTNTRINIISWNFLFHSYSD